MGDGDTGKVVPKFLPQMPELSEMQTLDLSHCSETSHSDFLKCQFIHLQNGAAHSSPAQLLVNQMS